MLHGSHHCYPMWLCTRWKCDVAGPGIWTYWQLKEIEVYTSIIDEAIRKLYLWAKILSACSLGVCKHYIFHCFTIATTHSTWWFFYQLSVKKGCTLSQVLSSLTLLATEHQKSQWSKKLLSHEMGSSQAPKILSEGLTARILLWSTT